MSGHFTQRSWKQMVITHEARNFKGNVDGVDERQFNKGYQFAKRTFYSPDRKPSSRYTS